MYAAWLAVVLLGALGQAADARADPPRGRDDGRYDGSGPQWRGQDDSGDEERVHGRGRDGWHRQRVRPGWMPRGERDVILGIAPSHRHVWIQAEWIPRGGFYVRSPGHWARRPYPRADWVPGHWEQTRRRWVWVESAWRRR